MVQSQFGSVWSAALIITLLQHLEMHKGEQGKYMCDRAQAYEDAANFVSSEHSQNSVTSKQVQRKLQHLTSAKYRRQKEQTVDLLYREGVTAIEESFLISLSQCAEDAKPSSEASVVPKPTNLVLDTGDMAPLVETRNKSTLPLKASLAKRNLWVQFSYKQAAPSGRMQQQPKKSSPSRNHSPYSRNKVTKSTQTSATSSNGLPGSTISLREQQRLTAIREYLIRDQDAYVPGCEELAKRKSELIQLITRAVRRLFDARNHVYKTNVLVSQERTPLISEALSSRPFFELCKRVFGAGTTKTVYEKSLRTYVLLEDFVRSMLGAAVHDWGLIGQRVDLSQHLHQKTELSFYESRIAEVHPELHELATRENSYRYVNEKLDVQELASQLSGRFNDAMRVFLGENGLLNFGPDCNSWLQDLDAVFLAAMQLRAQVALKGSGFTFRWPRADEALDPEYMMATEEKGIIDEPTVQMALFPALMQQMSSDAGMGEQGPRTIFHATVFLQ